LNLRHIKKIIISFCYYSKYISIIKNKKKTEKREKQEKKIVQKDVYWILQQKTKQEKIGSNQLGISSNLILQLLGS
jgi:hypothetical protein